MVYFIFYLFLFTYLHWVMSLTSFENGVAIVKRLRITGLDIILVLRLIAAKSTYCNFKINFTANSVRKILITGCTHSLY
jgi:hypothetical protein